MASFEAARKLKLKAEDLAQAIRSAQRKLKNLELELKNPYDKSRVDWLKDEIVRAAREVQDNEKALEALQREAVSLPW